MAQCQENPEWPDKAELERRGELQGELELQEKVVLVIRGPDCESDQACKLRVYLEDIELSNMSLQTATREPERLLIDTFDFSETKSEIELDGVEKDRRLVVESELYWCATDPIASASETRILGCELQPAQVLTGSVDIELDSTEDPSNGGCGLIGVALLPTAQRTPKNTLTDKARGQIVADKTAQCRFCEGQFSCVLPRGKWSARFELVGFSPYFVENLGIDSASPEPLRLRFSRGARVSGWLEASSGEAFIAETTSMQLLPVLGPDSSEPRRVATLRRLSPKVMIEGDGRFSFESVPAGQYIMRATADGFCPAEVRVGVPDPGHQVDLRKPVKLEPCGIFSMLVEPPVDLWGSQWTLNLRRHQSVTGTLGSAESSLVGWNGWGSLDALAPGLWKASLRDSKGAVWWADDVQVEAPVSEVVVRLASVEIRGNVIRDAEPIAGTLIFGTRNRSPSIPLTVSEDGRFSGYLPREGEWQLEFDDGQQTHFPADVRVERRPGKTYAEVEVSLSGTRLTGWVVEGEIPVEGAYVYAFREDEGLEREAFVRSDSEGKFLIENIRPGRLRVLARDGERSSESQVVQVRDDDEARELKLALQARVRVRGTVTSHGRGVAGARVLAFGPPGRSDLDRVTHTGMDGTFGVQLQPGGGAVHLAMVSAGYAFDIQGIALPRDRPGEVRFAAQSAGAHAVLPMVSGRPDAQILARGAVVSLERLLPTLLEVGAAAFVEPRSLRLHVAPGTWSICPYGRVSCVTETLYAGQTKIFGIELGKPKGEPN